MIFPPQASDMEGQMAMADVIVVNYALHYHGDDAKGLGTMEARPQPFRFPFPVSPLGFPFQFPLSVSLSSFPFQFPLSVSPFKFLTPQASGRRRTPLSLIGSS